MNQIRKGLKTTHGSERGEADDAGGVDFGSLQTQKDAMNQIWTDKRQSLAANAGVADDASNLVLGSLQTQKDAMNQLLKDYAFVSRTSPFTLDTNQTILLCTIASRILLCPLASFIWITEKILNIGAQTEFYRVSLGDATPKRKSEETHDELCLAKASYSLRLHVYCFEDKSQRT